MWEKRTKLFWKMMTIGQQMSCERPETPCYPSGERDSSEIVSWGAEARNLPSCVSPGWRTAGIRRTWSSPCPVGWMGWRHCPTHWSVISLVILVKFRLKIIFKFLNSFLLKDGQGFWCPLQVYLHSPSLIFLHIKYFVYLVHCPFIIGFTHRPSFDFVVVVLIVISDVKN